MTRLTVVEAARAGYAGRATIYRKLRAGLLSCETDADGVTVFDQVELTRVLGEPRPPREPSHEANGDASETERLRAENALLRVENADLRLHRDRLMALLKRTSLMPPPTPPGRLLSRLFGARRRT